MEQSCGGPGARGKAFSTERMGEKIRNDKSYLC